MSKIPNHGTTFTIEFKVQEALQNGASSLRLKNGNLKLCRKRQRYVYDFQIAEINTARLMYTAILEY